MHLGLNWSDEIEYGIEKTESDEDDILISEEEEDDNGNFELLGGWIWLIIDLHNWTFE